jgi:hypothetical protein
MKEDYKSNIHIQIPKDMHKKWKRRALENNLTLTQMIMDALYIYLSKESDARKEM